MNNFKLTDKACDYTYVCEMIKKAGYQVPKFDEGDSRQRELWQYIEDHSLDVVLRENIDYVNDIAERTNEFYRHFQPRANSENVSRINQLHETFYDLKVRMKRLPVAFIIDGKLFASAGNHRIRAHQKGMSMGLKAPRAVLIIDPYDKLTTVQKLLHGHSISSISNKQTDDETAQETTDDIANLVTTKYELECLFDISAKNWDECEKIDWGKAYVKSIRPVYDLKTNITALGRIVNQAFASHISQSIPFPPDTDLSSEWKRFWPRGQWDPQNNRVIQNKYVTHYNNFKKTIISKWLSREKWSDKNNRIEACVRVGDTLTANINSSKTVNSARRKYLQDITGWNTNLNVIESGMPIITKIMFVKQLSVDDFEAYEWNDHLMQFDQIKKNIKNQKNNLTDNA